MNTIGGTQSIHRDLGLFIRRISVASSAIQTIMRYLSSLTIQDVSKKTLPLKFKLSTSCCVKLTALNASN